jgi:hypothetical protein
MVTWRQVRLFGGTLGDQLEIKKAGAKYEKILAAWYDPNLPHACGEDNKA